MVTDPNNELEVRIENGYRSLWSLRKFRQGQTILGLPLTTQAQPDKYSIEAWPGIHLDCELSLAGAINHSCEPNSAVKGGAIVAWNCIQPGEQITIDYKRTERKLASPFDCNCGAKNCRRRIE